VYTTCFSNVAVTVSKELCMVYKELCMVYTNLFILRNFSSSTPTGWHRSIKFYNNWGVWFTWT